MQELTASTGGEFDQMFLRMMIAHHQGAVQMSQTELAQGIDVQSRLLAQEIISGQQVEINQMQKLPSRADLVARFVGSGWGGGSDY